MRSADLPHEALPAAGVMHTRPAPRTRAPQQALDPRQQLARIEGLAQVIVSADFEADDAVYVLALGREHDDGCAVIGRAQAPANRQAVFTGQHQVENHQGRLLAQNPRHRLRAVRLNGHAQAIGFEVLAGQLGQTLIVFHDKNLPALLLHHTHSCDRRAPIETRRIVTTPGVLHSACHPMSKTQHIVLSCDAFSIFKGHCHSHLTGDEWSPQGNPKAHAG